MVLDEVNSHDNEVWIAYVTDNLGPPAELQSSSSWGDSILYCMTVVTTPKALITSHMGINKTVAGYKKDVKNVAAILQAFAAKVMLLRNPVRRFMINAPVWLMESIIADALKDGGLYDDTREEFERLRILATTIRPKDFIVTEQGQEVAKKIKKEFPEITEAELKTKVLQKFYGLIPDVQLKDKKISRWHFIKDHPPIITLIRPPDMPKQQRFLMTIFEPGSDNVFLTISSANKDTYDWMFIRPFEPAGTTHYIAVDLKKLADLLK